MKNKILCVLQVPPPIGGVTMINQQIIASLLIRKHYQLDLIPIQFSQKMKNLGKLSPGKLLSSLHVI